MSEVRDQCSGDSKGMMVVDKLKRVKLLLLDVDGVLTDGSIIYNDNAEETKVFNVKDGLGIRLLIEAVMDSVVKRTGVLPEEIAFIGDDLPDLSLMKLVGLSIAVADAHEKLMEKADMVTSAKGGFGAVREVCETILKAQGLFENIIRRF
jgi:3-deoxy-D-manno-octulosonate 8-phosphate phosphatase (KDO 8-P phosphatase)